MQSSHLTEYENAEQAEQQRALQAAQSTYTERFYTLMRLIKVSAMISNAKIISSPVIPEKK